MAKSSTKLNIHEDFERDEKQPRPSERNFGLTFAVIFALVGLLKLYHGSTFGSAWLAGAAIFFALACFWYTPLKPLNYVWFRFSLFLFKVVNPIAMAILYVVSILPIGVLMRAAGRDPLDRRFRSATSSYWIDRSSAVAPSTMRDQF